MTVRPPRHLSRTALSRRAAGLAGAGSVDRLGEGERSNPRDSRKPLFLKVNIVLDNGNFGLSALNSAGRTGGRAITARTGESQMRTRSFTVRQRGRFLFTLHAYTLAQARALIAARLSDLTGVTLSKGAQR
jgi:hypothetical protein